MYGWAGCTYAGKKNSIHILPLLLPEGHRKLCIEFLVWRSLGDFIRIGTYVPRWLYNSTGKLGYAQYSAAAKPGVAPLTLLHAFPRVSDEENRKRKRKTSTPDTLSSRMQCAWGHSILTPLATVKSYVYIEAPRSRPVFDVVCLMANPVCVGISSGGVSGLVVNFPVYSMYNTSVNSNVFFTKNGSG